MRLRGLYETRVGILINLRSDAAPSDTIALHSLKLLYKFVRTFGKFFRRVQQVDPARFVELPVCDDLVLYYWEKVVQANSSAELIEGMLRESSGSMSLNTIYSQTPKLLCSPFAFSWVGWSCSRRVSLSGPHRGKQRQIIP